MALTGNPIIFNHTPISATTTINANGQDGVLGMIVVGSSTAGTLAVADANGPILATTGSITAPFVLNLPTTFQGPLTITVGGALTATVFWV